MISALTTVFFFLFAAALAWRIYQLVLSPRLPNWAVTVTIAAFALAFLLQQRGASTRFDSATTQGGARLAVNVLLSCAVFSLLIFFLGSTLGPRRARRVALELVPLAAAVGVLIAGTVLTPVPLRGAPLGPATVHEPGVALFYLGGGLYLIYAITACAVWIVRYQRVADPYLRTGLRIGAASLVAAAAGSVFRALYTVFALFGAKVPLLLVVGIPLVIIGSLLFLAGISYPGVRARIAALARRRRHRADHARLAPLWTELVKAYPSIVLRTPPGPPWRERFAVHRRYYRRVIEIRDGLVQLSPYLEADLASLAGDDPAAAAEALRSALARQAAGEENDGRAKLVLPGGSDLESDVRPLLSLSASLAGREN
ncbi:MAG TPA: MAB_1171c family putative transporter [Amycolatopsis sp.]|nr:MAB_1171c family putative transporter [Amycolatopsis sp.]